MGFNLHGFPKKIQFNQGYSAFFKNFDCPYRMGTDKQKEWQRGFDAAYFKHKETLTR